MNNDKHLRGKAALITGAARGIGREIALALAGAGAAVAVADLEAGGDDATHRVIQSRGGKSVFKKLDVADFDSVQSVFGEVVDELGGLDVLVNNAGMNADQVVGRMKPDQWSRVIEVNLGGCFNCCRAATRIMVKQQRGRIINISSIVARAGRAGQANYAASKAGIEGLTISLALELAHRGITVNAIAPGYIDTHMTRALPEAVRAEIIERIPMRRPGSAKDVADLALFLAGPGADYITGQVIHVNGGLYFG